MTTAFILILLLLSYFDLRYRVIPNIVTLPLIVLGSWLTGSWSWTVIMFGIMAFLYWKKIFCGGDVKLMTMLATFFGLNSFLVFFFAAYLLVLYHVLIRNDELPFTPFVLIGFILVTFGQAVTGMVL